MKEGKVTFEEDTAFAPRAAAPASTRKVSAFSRMMMSLKLAGNEKEAQYVLAGIAVAALLIAGIVFFTSARTVGKVPTPAQLQPYLQAMNAAHH